MLTRFEGSDSYVATEDLTVAVNAAVTLERPLLVKGEPGTGKTELARQVAAALGLPILEWHIKSTTRAQQGFTNTTPSAACATASWAMRASTTCATTSARASCGKPLRHRRKMRPPDRRDRQGRHRVSQRPAAGIGPDGILRLRDRRDDPRQDAAHRHHHLEQRKGTARRVPAGAVSFTTSAFPTWR
jgi:hypothetical protein